LNFNIGSKHMVNEIEPIYYSTFCCTPTKLHVGKFKEFVEYHTPVSLHEEFL